MRKGEKKRRRGTAERIGNYSGNAEGPHGYKYKAIHISIVMYFSLASYNGLGLGAEQARSWG